MMIAATPAHAASARRRARRLQAGEQGEHADVPAGAQRMRVAEKHRARHREAGEIVGRGHQRAGEPRHDLRQGEHRYQHQADHCQNAGGGIDEIERAPDHAALRRGLYATNAVHGKRHVGQSGEVAPAASSNASARICSKPASFSSAATSRRFSDSM